VTVELTFQGPESVPFQLRELQAEKLFLQLANAVLARNASAQRYGRSRQREHRLSGLYKLFPAVRKNVDVQVHASNVPENE